MPDHDAAVQRRALILPMEWHFSKVKHLGQYVNGYPFKPDDWGDFGKPILRIQNLTDTTASVNRCSRELPKRYLVTHGDLIISWSASLGVYRWDGEDSWLNQHSFKVILEPTIEVSFFYWLATWFMHELDVQAHGSTMQHLTQDAFGKFLVPIPPVFVQRAIADYLDWETGRIDLLVAAKQRLLDILAEKRRALITRAVTRGLDPNAPMRDSGIPWVGEIPKHWKVKRAKYLFRQSALPVGDNDEMVTCFRDGQVTLRRNRRETGFTNGEIEFGYQGIRNGQLVLHSMDAFAGAIGVSDSDGKCTPEYIICDPTGSDVANPYYGSLLRTMALNGFVLAICPAVRQRAPRIRFNDFAEVYLPVPPLPEQRAIAAYIAEQTARLDALRDAAQRSIDLLKERRAALIAAAVTGQLDIPVPKEVADEHLAAH